MKARQVISAHRYQSFFDGRAFNVLGEGPFLHAEFPYRVEITLNECAWFEGD